MSGGSYEYAYQKVQRFAEAMRSGEDFDGDKREVPAKNRTLRKMLAHHLDAVAEAMKAVEWTDSGDSGYEDEEAAIRAVIGTARQSQK